MAKNPIPSADYLRQLLRYEPETGLLYWKERPPEAFVKTRRNICQSWNSRYAGKPAGRPRDGYAYISVGNRCYCAHRLIWTIVYGYAPEAIDHINGDRSDNRLTNLRAANQTANMRNRGLSRNNTSGVMGVSRSGERWQATIGVGGKTIYLGCFSTLDEAASARKTAEFKYGFHPNHGQRQGMPELR